MCPHAFFRLPSKLVGVDGSEASHAITTSQIFQKQLTQQYAGSYQEARWTHWDLSPGPSACEADVIPLHHVPPRIRNPQGSKRCRVCFFLSSTLVSKAVPRAETDKLDTLGIEPRAFRMQSGCDTATPCAHMHSDSRMPQQYTPRDRHRANHERFRASSSGYTGIFHPDWT